MSQANPNDPQSTEDILKALLALPGDKGELFLASRYSETEFQALLAYIDKLKNEAGNQWRTILRADKQGILREAAEKAERGNDIDFQRVKETIEEIIREVDLIERNVCEPVRRVGENLPGLNHLVNASTPQPLNTSTPQPLPSEPLTSEYVAALVEKIEAGDSGSLSQARRVIASTPDVSAALVEAAEKVSKGWFKSLKKSIKRGDLSTARGLVQDLLNSGYLSPLLEKYANDRLKRGVSCFKALPFSLAREPSVQTLLDFASQNASTAQEASKMLGPFLGVVRTINGLLKLLPTPASTGLAKIFFTVRGKVELILRETGARLVALGNAENVLMGLRVVWKVERALEEQLQGWQVLLPGVYEGAETPFEPLRPVVSNFIPSPPLVQKLAEEARRGGLSVTEVSSWAEVLDSLFWRNSDCLFALKTIFGAAELGAHERVSAARSGDPPAQLSSAAAKSFELCAAFYRATVARGPILNLRETDALFQFLAKEFFEGLRGVAEEVVKGEAVRGWGVGRLAGFVRGGENSDPSKFERVSAVLLSTVKQQNGHKLLKNLYRKAPFDGFCLRTTLAGLTLERKPVLAKALFEAEDRWDLAKEYLEASEFRDLVKLLPKPKEQVQV